ncbi:MAG: hypothetical protein PHV82_02180 [Victivallaceae bacterium]|nr:hypothetical protein [Victivallaceae bacterium]
MNEQHKQLLKVGIAALFAIVLCSWAAYRWFSPGTERYNDFAVDSAVVWLENADKGDFDDCRKDIIDKNGWFDWFVKDRKSLGTIKARNLSSRRELPGAAKGMKRYELKFDSKFSFMTHPKSRFTERMIIETDGKKQFKVLMVYLSVSGNFAKIKRSATEDEKIFIMAAAENIKTQLDSRNIAFFKRQYAESAQVFPDKYLRKYFVRSAKKPEMVIILCNFRTKGKSSQLKFIKIDDIYMEAGQTGLEETIVQYSFSVNSEGKSENFILFIHLFRNLYSDKNMKWKFYMLTFHEEKRYKIMQKLGKLKIIKRINFKNVPLRDAVKLLQEKGKQYDPENTGVNIILRLSPEDAGKNTLISLDLSDKPLFTAAYFLSKEAKLKFYITKDGIVLASPDKR